MDTLLENITDVKLKEELNSCKLFFVDCVLEKTRHFVFDFAMSSFNNSFLNKKLDHMYNQLKCPAKINPALGFVLKSNEDGTCRFFYVHENKTIMERPKLVCIQDDIVNLEEKRRKSILLIIAQEKDLTLNGDFVHFQMLQFLTQYSKCTHGL